MEKMNTSDLVLIIGNLVGGATGFLVRNNINTSSDHIDKLLKDEGDDD
jgi:hypothetical protein